MPSLTGTRGSPKVNLTEPAAQAPFLRYGVSGGGEKVQDHGKKT